MIQHSLLRKAAYYGLGISGVNDRRPALDRLMRAAWDGRHMYANLCLAASFAKALGLTVPSQCCGGRMR